MAVRRLVLASTPRGFAFCEQCDEQLSYEYGSIMWRCQKRDLCPTCAGRDAARRIIESNPLPALKG